MRLQKLPDGIRILAPAKVNLFLHVGPRRADGFHEIDSVFQAVGLFDALEVLAGEPGEMSLEETGIQAGRENLVYRAAELLRAAALERGAPVRGARLRLLKGIPEGAGLGGGSSDAAAALLGLALHWGLRLERVEIEGLAARLGSDVPFFLQGGAARCQGRGERVTSWRELAGESPPLHFVLVYPREKVETALAYRLLAESRSRGEAGALTASSPLATMQPSSAWRELVRGKLCRNSFEEVIYERFPRLSALRDLLGGEGFRAVLLSGSGSTVFGLAANGEEARAAAERVRSRLGERGLEGDVYCVASEPAHDGLGVLA